MRETWFTSDLHFYHKNVIEYCKRPYSCVDDMHEGLINNWNACVTDIDRIYILGDFCFAGTKAMSEILKRLRGEKHLILGNHDHFKPHRTDLGFSSITYDGNVNIGKHSVLLSHYPYRGDHTESERFTERRLKDQGSWLLHGHIHDKWKTLDRQINVGVDVWNMRPVHYEEIRKIIYET